jgi:hypothetical protein
MASNATPPIYTASIVEVTLCAQLQTFELEGRSSQSGRTPTDDSSGERALLVFPANRDRNGAADDECNSHE